MGHHHKHKAKHRGQPCQSRFATLVKGQDNMRGIILDLQWQRMVQEGIKARLRTTLTEVQVEVRRLQRALDGGAGTLSAYSNQVRDLKARLQIMEEENLNLQARLDDIFEVGSMT